MENKEVYASNCPVCDGAVKLIVSIRADGNNNGVYAHCQKCGAKTKVCDISEVKTYDGCKIRKSTVKRITKMWNKMAETAEKG